MKTTIFKLDRLSRSRGAPKGIGQGKVFILVFHS